MKIKNYKEKYINKMKKNSWELKNQNNKNLIFEKTKSESKIDNKFIKDDLYKILILLTLIPLICFQAYNLAVNFFVDTVSSTSVLIVFIVLLIAIIFIFIEIIENIYSYFKFKIDNSGEKLIYEISIKEIKIKSIISTIKGSVMIIIVLLSFGLFTTFDDYVNVTKSNIEIPIKLTDLDKNAKGKYENKLTISTSFLGENINIEESVYDENQENSDMDFFGDMDIDIDAYMNIEIFISEYDWVLEKGLKSIFKQRSEFFQIEEVSKGKELEYWNANKLYKTDFNEYILVYDNMVIDVYGDIDFNKKNIEKILKICEYIKQYD